MKEKMLQDKELEEKATQLLYIKKVCRKDGIKENEKLAISFIHFFFCLSVTRLFCVLSQLSLQLMRKSLIPFSREICLLIEIPLNQRKKRHIKASKVMSFH